jgi:CBS domain-containing protein
MLVAELIRSKGSEVATVHPGTTLTAVVERLRAENIGAVVVSDDGSSIDGIVSERDIVRALGPATDLEAMTAAQVMTGDVITCVPRDRVDELMALMTEKRIRHLPVEVDGALAGIISIGDVVKCRVNELEHEAKELGDYIRQGR